MNKQTKIETCGNRRWPRYRIRDRKRGYWTGQSWTQVTADAKLYCKYQHATKDLAELELLSFKKPTATYKSSVSIDVFSDQPIDLDKLKDYLTEQAKLELQKPAPEGSTVHVHLNWDDLEEVDQSDCSKPEATEET